MSLQLCREQRKKPSDKKEVDQIFKEIVDVVTQTLRTIFQKEPFAPIICHLVNEVIVDSKIFTRQRGMVCDQQQIDDCVQVVIETVMTNEAAEVRVCGIRAIAALIRNEGII